MRKAVTDGEKIFSTVVSTSDKIKAAAVDGKWKIFFGTADALLRSETCELPAGTTRRLYGVEVGPKRNL